MVNEITFDRFFHHPREFKPRFHGVGAGGTGELDFVIEVARFEHNALHFKKQLFLGNGGHVQTMNDPVRFQILDELLFHVVIVVPVIERARSRKKVNVAVAVRVE